MVDKCLEIGNDTGASLKITENIDVAVKDCDFLYTDVWVSMGEPIDVWEKRINLLKPFQVNKELMEKTGNPGTKFLHCLPLSSKLLL